MPAVSVETRRRPAEDPNIDMEAQQHREQCPRCDSTDTKFCYYNNYNTSQPRHFCKSCRRYWTLGGSLRNVPIGGSTRKRLRPSPIPSQYSKQPRAGTSLLPSLTFGPNGLLSSPLAALSVPFLQDRVGFELGLGLGLGPRSCSGPNSDCLDEVGLGYGLGNGPVMWPAVSMINEAGNMIGHGDTWKMESGRMELPLSVPPPMGIWQELAVSAPVETSSAHGAQLL